MTTYRRPVVPGGTFFFTVVTFGRRRFLTDDLARACLRNAWRETMRWKPFQQDAVCLLPDHLHCIWTFPPDDSDFSSRWSFLKGSFTRQYLQSGGPQGVRGTSRIRKGEAAIWQRRFRDHAIRDEKDFARHVDYIHFNPVKHGLVSRPKDWPWSSFNRYVKLGWYEEDWGDQEPKDVQGMKEIE